MSTPEFQPLGELLPCLYTDLFPELAASTAPVESAATCGECAMCPDGDTPRRPGVFFSPDAKCCTFHPSLPNYLVGALLADECPEFAEGRRRIGERIAQRIGVTPHGIGAAPHQRLLYDAVSRSVFGRAESLTCPYFEARHGRCTIWQFREAVCATYYCKFVHGEDGASYWRALKDVLTWLQLDLARYALHALGFAAHQVLAARRDSPTAEALDGKPTPDAEHRQRFGPWYGREAALFQECYRAVSELTPQAATALGGLRATLQAQELATRLDAVTTPRLPDPLLRNPALVQHRLAHGSMMVTSFSHLQPMRMRREVLELLDAFDGQTATDEVLACIESTRGLRLSRKLLERLHQFRFLVAPDAG